MARVKCYVCGKDRNVFQCPSCGKIICKEHINVGWVSGTGKCPSCKTEIKGRHKVG